MTEKTKKTIASLLITANLFLPANITLAKEESKTHTEVKVYFNNEEIKFDQKPIIIDGRTKVPFRAIFETMGTVVYYRQSDNSILGITRSGDSIYHKIGTNTATINNEIKTYDSSSEIINDRTLIPARMVSDLLYASIDWNEEKQEVHIEKEIVTNEYTKVIREILDCVVDDNFNPEDFKRYIDYKIKNPNMNTKQVILDVNMDMDKELVEVKKRMNGKDHIYYVAKDEDIEIVNNSSSPLVLLNKFHKLPNDYKNQYYIMDTLAGELAYNFSGPIPTREGLGDNYYVWWMYYFVNDNFSCRSSKNYLLLDYFQMRKAAIEAGCVNDTLDDQSKYKVPSDNFFDFDYCFDVRRIINDVTDNPYIQNGPIIGEYNCELSTGNLLNISAKNGPDYSVFRYLLVNGYVEETKKLNSSLFDYYVKGINENPKGFEAEMKTYAWLEQNAYKYGFVPRYPRNKESITRYQYLPEYYKYVGRDVAKIMHDNNWCFEEYYARYLNPTEYKTDLNSTIEKVLKRY